MVRKDGAEARKERIQQVAKIIQRRLYNEGEISLLKTLAFLQYETGLTPQKLMEYLTILEEMGQFILDADGDKIKKISKAS
jgi:hypothetical protein